MIRKGMWRILITALVVLVPVKTAADILIEDGTMWKECLPWVLIGVCLLLFLACRLDKRAIMRFRPRPCPIAGAMALVSAAGILAASLYELFRLVRGESDVTTLSLAGNQPLLAALCAIAGLLAAIVMAVWGVSLFRSGALFQQYPITAMILPIWACLELILLFVTYTAQSEVSRNFYSIFPFALGLLFLFSQSSFFSDAGGGVARRKLYQYGAPFVLMGIASSVPGLVRLALGYDSGSSLSAPMLAVLLALSLYALACMVMLRRDTNLLLRPGKGKRAPAYNQPSLSMTLELERVLADWKGSQKEKEEPEQSGAEESEESLLEEDLLPNR